MNLRAFAIRKNLSEGYKISKPIFGFLVCRLIMPMAESSKFHICPRSFASRPNNHFSDIVSRGHYQSTYQAPEGVYLLIKPSDQIFIFGYESNTNRLLTELARANTGEYWPEVVAVRTERSEVRNATSEGQYSPVWPEQARLVSCLLYGTLFLIVKCTSGAIFLAFYLLVFYLFSFSIILSFNIVIFLW